MVIKKYLDENGIKYSYVADGMKIKSNVFSSIINGKRKISIEEYLEICGILNLDINYFAEILKTYNNNFKGTS